MTFTNWTIWKTSSNGVNIAERATGNTLKNAKAQTFGQKPPFSAFFVAFTKLNKKNSKCKFLNLNFKINIFVHSITIPGHLKPPFPRLVDCHWIF